MLQQPKTRVRAFTRRTRAGCLTCKTRRKKCDEQRPICNRCKVGGFVCDGYEADGAVAPPKKKENRGLMTPPSSTDMPSSGSSSRSSSSPMLVMSSASRYHGSSGNSNSRCLLPLQPAAPRALSRHRHPQLQRSLMLPGDPRETHFYMHFFTDTVGDLVISHSIGTDFWNQLLQPSSQHADSVRHAVMALGAVHWQLNMHDPSAPPTSSTVAVNQFALRHYNDAISALVRKPKTQQQHQQHQLEHQPSPQQGSSISDIVTTVTCCFLFVVLESMRGDYAEALRHMEAGMTIIANHNYQHLQPSTGHSPVRDARNDDVAAAATLSQLAAIFDSLSSQIATFSPKRLFPDLSPIRTPMKKYPSRAAQLRDLDEAEDVMNSFEDMMNYMFYDMPPDWEDPNGTCVAQWDAFKLSVVQWKTQFDDLTSRLTREGTFTANFEKIVNLRVQHKMWTLTVEALSEEPTAGSISGSPVPLSTTTLMTPEDGGSTGGVWEDLIAAGPRICSTPGSSTGSRSSTDSSGSFARCECPGMGCDDEECAPEPADLTPEECSALLDEVDLLWYSPTRPKYGLKVDLLTAIYQLYVYCEDEGVRLRIIGMLRARRRREIIWDSAALADFLEKDMANKRAWDLAENLTSAAAAAGEAAESRVAENVRKYNRWPDIGPSPKEHALVVFRPKRQDV